jgi:N-terminal domain of anti-restriction factor ArdC
MGSNLSQRAREMAADALARLDDEIRTGQSALLDHYLEAIGRFRRQSWVNVLLIAAQRPEATQVATSGAWRAVGRSVCSGEKGVLVMTGEGQAARGQYVYDINQTAGPPLPHLGRPASSAQELVEHLRALAQHNGTPSLTDPRPRPEGLRVKERTAGKNQRCCKYTISALRHTTL